MRQAGKTPEPVPDKPSPHSSSDAPIFVIQEHHASRLHWDFRLEHSGVLVSWAVPKGPPLAFGENRLAVMTEDHPLGYVSFQGTIPKGQYGAGTVTIWDAGTCTLEKWREGTEIIAVLHGKPKGGLGGVPRRYALIHTPGMGAGKKWLIHLMKAQPSPDEAGNNAANREDVHGRAGQAPAGTPSQVEIPEATVTTWSGKRHDLPAPMLATAATTADMDPEHSWSLEMKWDGMRTIAGVADGVVTLVSRNGNNVTEQYPELQELATLTVDDSVLDGEIIALNTLGRPDFSLLQQRMKLTSKREIAKKVRKVPVHLMVFDALQLGTEKAAQDGSAPQVLVQESYTKRRHALFATVREGTHVHLPPAHTGTIEEAVATSHDLGLEGIVAKRNDSRYTTGRRSPAWRKIKDERHQEVVIIGWHKGSGSRRDTLGSLLLAVHDRGHLHYVGRVASGFSTPQLKAAAVLLKKIRRKTPPANDVPAASQRDVVWVTPRLVGEVKFTEKTRDGRLRHPSWRGWRPDKAAEDVHWEF
ncbi:non-homologous end-joining DNA ligase [Arthrobacter alpinus]|uniref:non-homologous end-joining DNA ligase n=1 Tax=Arthrobacter alpinus TaxID=656366 RepID=UPI000B2188FD